MLVCNGKRKEHRSHFAGFNLRTTSHRSSRGAKAPFVTNYQEWVIMSIGSKKKQHPVSATNPLVQKLPWMMANFVRTQPENHCWLVPTLGNQIRNRWVSEFGGVKRMDFVKPSTVEKPAIYQEFL